MRRERREGAVRVKRLHSESIKTQTHRERMGSCFLRFAGTCLCVAYLDVLMSHARAPRSRVNSVALLLFQFISNGSSLTFRADNGGEDKNKK